MAKAKKGRSNVGASDRIGRLERAQNETNRRLGRIEDTLATSSRLFELMHQRLEALEEGQTALVQGQAALVEGQKLVIERLDRLVDAATGERTALVERLAVVENRLDRIEDRRGDG